MTRVETVVIIYQPPKLLLLGMKKRGLGSGRYNGFGGGVEQNETVLGCAERETYEETGKGIRLLDLEEFGRILFQFESGEQDHQVHFLRASQFTGIPRETEEMKPEWFDENSIPYSRMWASDSYWLPLLLKGKRFVGKFLFNSHHQIVDKQLNEVEELG